MNKTVNEIANSIAPCGLVCSFCSNNCKGCNFSENSEIKCTCFQRKCCRDKGIAGCWECTDFPCDKGMFDEKQHGIRPKAFVRCAKEDSLTALAEYLVRNKQNGIMYHQTPQNYTGDYDGLQNEEEVLKLLRTGEK